MPVPPVYRRASESITSYPFRDIADNTGVIVYYGGIEERASTISSGVLIADTLYSNYINSQGPTPDASFTLVIDRDFDVIFNAPANMKGKIRVNITVGGRTISAAPNAWQAYAILKLRKVDLDSNEIEIANAQTKTTSGGGGAVNTKHSENMLIELDASADVTHFKIGETLRLTVELWGKRTGTNPVKVGFAHDPKDRNDVTAINGGIIEDADSTTLKMHIPFILDI